MAEDLLSQKQAFALIDELESATRLVDLGIGELHALSLGNAFYHLPMQMPAQGFERFLKLTYAMTELGRSGSLSGRAEIRTYGHDLTRVTDDLTGIVELAHEYARRPAVREDLDFVRSNDDFRRVLALLSEFAQQGRYHRLNEFLAPGSVGPDDDPYRRWQELELEIIQRQPSWSEHIRSQAGAEQLQRAASEYIAYLLDRFARAVARMWTLGALPDEARRYTTLVGTFLFLGDDALGNPRR